MIRHRCPRMTKTVEIAYEEHWKTWDIYGRNEIITVFYCPYCGKELRKTEAYNG